MSEKPISQHIFIFPFRWNIKGKRGPKQITDLTKINIDCTRAKTKNDYSGKWVRSPYQLDNELNYNEYQYFHDFVRKAIYDEGEKRKHPVFRHYEYNCDEKMFFCIEASKSYRLEITDVLLNFYETGVGVLSFHLINYAHPGQDEILEINQKGRRIFPPFLVNSTSANDFAALESVMPKEVSIEIACKNEVNHVTENFKKFFNKKDLIDLKPELYIPDHLRYFLNFDYLNMQIQPVIDERMYVICWYANSKLRDELFPKGGDLNFLNMKYPYWHQYLFVDGQLNCSHQSMFEDLTDRHTYKRWLGEGTIYGVTRYSFMCLTTDNAPDYISTHVMHHYYKMAELCLVQRASLLVFSDRVTNVSSIEDKDTPKKIKDIYKDYIRFVNKLFFREITPQEQGIELYDLFQKNMAIPANVKDLDAEIEELHRYSTMLVEQQQTEIVSRLSFIATIFAIGAFVTGFYGMNIFDGNNLANNGQWHLGVITMLLIFCPLLIGLGYYVVSLSNKKKIAVEIAQFFWNGIFILVYIVIIGFLLIAGYWVTMMPIERTSMLNYF